MLFLEILMTMPNINPKVLELHVIIEKIAREIEYGAASFTIPMKNGIPLTDKIQITKSRRYKKPTKLAKTNS